jgi:hypothetical protein
MKRSSLHTGEATASLARTPIHVAVGTDDTQDPESPMEITKEEKGQNESPFEDREHRDASNSPGSVDFKRSFGNIRWGLIAVGLCLGAFLYGMFWSQAAITRPKITNSAQDLIQLLLLMYKVQFLNHLAR